MDGSEYQTADQTCSRIGAPILKPWLHDIELKMV